MRCWVVAVVIAIVSVWRLRLAISLALTLAVTCAVHIAYFIRTTAPGRHATAQAADWRRVPLASGARGVAENRPDVFGRARLN